MPKIEVAAVLVAFLLAPGLRAGEADATARANQLERQRMVHEDRGELGQALVLARKVLRLRESVLQPDHPDVATALNGLGVLLLDTGDIKAARPILERALAIRRKVLEPDHISIAQSLNEMGRLLDASGERAGARQHFEQALRIDEKNHGTVSTHVATDLNNLAGIHYLEREYEAARPLYQRSLDIRIKLLGIDHPDVALSYSNLALALAALEDDKGAGVYLERAVSVLEKAVAEGRISPIHPTLSAVLQNYADFLRDQAKYATGRETMRRAFSVLENGIEPLLGVTSERERIALVNAQRDMLHRFLWVFHLESDAADAYDAVLRWKGLVAQSMIRQREIILGAQEPRLKSKFEALTRVRQDLAKLVFAGPAPGSGAAHAAEVRKLTASKETLERQLAQLSQTYRRGTERKAPSVQQICKALGKNEALVDILRYKGHRFASEGAGYVAFVLRGGDCKSPVRVELGPASAIDEGVGLYRKLLDKGARARRLNRRAWSLREKVWDPVAKHLEGRTWIWLVPDSSLNSLPFSALVDEELKFLVEQYTFSYLPSAQELDRLARKDKRKVGGALVAGGIDYDASGGGVPGAAAAGAADGIRALVRVSGMFPVPALPGTAKEADTVAARLGKKLGRKGLVKLTGGAPGEARIKRELPGKRFVHLATHGFFATGELRESLGEGGGGTHRGLKLGQARPRPAPDSGATAGPPVDLSELNPLLLSGLILAGANKGGTAEEDGILTAEEVVGLDLRGTELVALSACETGLGEIEEGEGVMGLRRAFSVAGARALVMSLWKVPDRETMLLMEDFYRRITGQRGKSKARALREAQLALIARLRKETGGADPRAWAAFFVSGR